jgi:hypothetical protein
MSAVPFQVDGEYRERHKIVGEDGDQYKEEPFEAPMGSTIAVGIDYDNTFHTIADTKKMIRHMRAQ